MIWALLLVVAASGCTDDGGPRLDAVTPAAAARNATVTLTGSRLCGPSGDCENAGGEVLLGISPPQISAQLLAYDASSAQVVVPNAAPTGPTDVLITVNDQTSNALAFEVLP